MEVDGVPAGALLPSPMFVMLRGASDIVVGTCMYKEACGVALY